MGTHGKIRAYEAPGGQWRATTKYRDHDGVTRVVERIGRSRSAAIRRLKEALRDRTSTGRGTVTGDTKVSAVAEQWFERIAAAVETGTRSPSTSELYRRQLDNHVLPGLGAFRIREVSVPVVDRFLAAVRERSGIATAKTCRSIVSGVLGLAVRHGAMAANPVRETERIEGGSKRTPRALTLDERRAWLARLEADELAVRRDLPDLCRFMLATGVRIGEALAVLWEDVDDEAGTVDVDYTVVRIPGVGLRRKSTKTSAGERTLPLPSWAVAMLRTRWAGSGVPTEPVFPDSLGGLRDPANTRRALRDARGSEDFAWVTSHVFRKTAATILDEAGLSARAIADQLGHSRPSLTQDVYMGRNSPGRAAADALEGAANYASSSEK